MELLCESHHEEDDFFPVILNSISLRVITAFSLSNSNIILKYFSIYCQSLCNKLFLTRIIKENKIDFPLHLSICEDSCFILDYILHINSVYCSDKPIYHYVQNNSAS